MKTVKEFPRLKKRITLIKNHQSIGSLGNRFLSMTDHCEKGSIILDVDPNDVLISRQVMKLFNALYHNSSNWLIHTNYLWHRKN